MVSDHHVRPVVITVSTRCARGEVEDRSGPLLVELLADAGYGHAERTVVTDGVLPVREAITEALDAGARIILTTGGTGLTPTDRTPEATRALLDAEIPGIPEEIRRSSVAQAPHAVLTRGLAGTSGDAFILNLPGSPAAVTDAMAAVAPLLPHILDQLRGGHHG